MVVRLTVRELRAQLAGALRRAEAGGRIIVTSAGRPVAEIGPIEGTGPAPTIEALAARGLVLPARRSDRPASDLVVALPVGTRLDRLLAEVR